MVPRKIKVTVDLEELCVAFEFSSVDNRYYLDLETGEIINISDEFVDHEEKEELERKVEEGFGKRYVSIPYASSDESYKDMEDFVETLEDQDLKEKLYIAIDGRGAFRRFKDVLLGYPEERERWFKFKDARVTERINEWLEAEGIEMIEVQPIEIEEVDHQELRGSKEVEETWEGFSPIVCLECGNEEGFRERHFILSRCPEKVDEEEWLDETMIKQYGVEYYGVVVGALGDERGLIVSAVCRRCGSQNVFYDF